MEYYIIGFILFLATWCYMDVYYWHIWSSRRTQHPPDADTESAEEM